MMTGADRSRVGTAERGLKLIDQLDRWVSRTAFVHRPDYDFSLEYRKAVKQMLEDDAARVRANAAMGPQQREAEAKRIEASLEEFQAIFAPASDPSPWQMSRAGVQAALFIIVYRDRPVLQLPFRLLAALMNVDELLTLWRYRHALMVQRMIGVKIGTGGAADKKGERLLGDLPPRARGGVAAILALPDPATIAFAPNTHDFVRRLISALPAGAVPRILTSDSEFHSFTRQIARLEEDGLVALERIAAPPFPSFGGRFAAAARPR